MTRSTFLVPQTEAEWQRFVTDYAESLGWDWMHIGRTGKYTANGAKGTLGEGWPDLLLIRGKRLIFAEVKGEKGTLSEAQKRVRLKLDQAADYYVWRPSDAAHMMAVLNGG